MEVGFIVNRDYEKAHKEYWDTIASKHKVSSLTVKKLTVYISLQSLMKRRSEN